MIDVTGLLRVLRVFGTFVTLSLYTKQEKSYTNSPYTRNSRNRLSSFYLEGAGRDRLYHHSKRPARRLVCTCSGGSPHWHDCRASLRNRRRKQFVFCIIFISDTFIY
jgi:hypothetical protein